LRLTDALGLVAAIAWYGEKRLKPVGIALDLNAEGLAHRLPSDLEIALFRITQEAITNVIRHANASQVSVQIADQAGNLTLQVTDNGCGFDPQFTRAGDGIDRAFGLRGMRERCDLLGGSFDLLTVPGQGTTITVRVPERKE
jgi:signal transduction histidine kinase